MTERSPNVEPFPHAARDEVAAWLAENDSKIPEAVRVALQQHGLICDALCASRRKLSEVVQQLRLALGVVPRSEKSSSEAPLGAVSGGDGKRPRSKAEKLRVGLERLQRLSEWHRDLGDRHKKKAASLEEKLRNLPVEEIPLTAEQQSENARETAELMQRFSLGEGPEPALESARGTLMTGAEVTTSEQTEFLAAPEPDSEAEKVVSVFTEERIRHDLTLVVGTVTAEVEKKVVEDARGNRRILSASTSELGPPRYAVTWRFLTNVVVLAVQYAMPMNRLGNLLSTDAKRFTAAALSRMLRFVAQHLIPIYLCLFDELADAAVLAGDDTTTRVLEVKRYFARPESQEKPPWDAYRNRESAGDATTRLGADSFEAKLSRELGFEFPRRKGDGAKTSLNTTTISGRADQNDPRSLIVFYRSHLGGLGNLLEVLLERRSKRAVSLTMLSDLSTVNLVHDPVLRQRFEIRQVGCSAHARRPFSLYKHDDPDICSHMLHLFKGFAIHEHGLDLHGRNSENVKAVRGTDSRRLWDTIRELAVQLTKRWPPDSKLGEGARYIIRHYDALTAYLDDPEIPPTSRVGSRRGGVQAAFGCVSRFQLRARLRPAITPFPAPATSNRTGGFPASGLPRRRHHTGVMVPCGPASALAAAQYRTW